MSLKCECPEWAPNIEKVNGPIIEKSFRSGFTWQYDGEKFRYCPWCGKALTEAAALRAELEGVRDANDSQV